MKKAFVTGATGQLGSALVELLVKTGYEITCVVHTIEEQDTSFLQSLGIDHIYHVDLAKAETYQQYMPEGCIVFHGFSLSPGANAPQEVYDLHNLHVSQKLLEVAERKKVQQFVYLGSCSVIGPKATRQHFISEEDNPNPDEPYGRSKLAVEHEVKQFHGATSIPCLILRIFPIYGPHCHVNASPVRFCQLLRKKWFFVIGGGENAFEFGYTRNVAQGIVMAAEQRTRGFEVFNIAEPVKRRYIEIIRELARHVNPDVNIVSVPVPLAVAAGYTGDLLTRIFNKRFIFRTRSVKGLRGGWLADCRKQVEVLGYTQPYTMEEGVAALVTYVKENGLLEKKWEKPDYPVE